MSDAAPPARRRRRSIAQRLSLAVTAITTLFTILTVLVLLGYSWHRDNEALAQRADSTMVFLTNSLRLPLWALDLEAVATIGQAVMQSEAVSRLEITGSRGETVFAEERPGGVAFERHAIVTHEGRHVGAVRIGIGELPRRRRLWSLAVVAGLTGFSVIVLQLVLIGPLLRRHLRAPFESLDATVHEYLAGRYDTPAPEIDYEEFQPLTDVLARMGRRVDEQLRELGLAEAKYRRIFEKARVGIFQTTPEGRPLEVNPAFAELIGHASREELLAEVSDVGTQVYADPTDRADFLRSLLAEGRVVRRELRLRRRDGSLTWAAVTAETVLDEQGKPVLIEGLADDITEHREVQELRLQTEKMLSVGGLAAGMAHELNNPLGIILQACENLERRLSPGLPANRPVAEATGVDLGALREYLERRGIEGYLEAMRAAAERASRIIRTMLEFSRKASSAESASCSLEPIVQTALELASKDFDLKRRFDFRSVRINRELDAATPRILCASGEMVQVVFNIVKNAAEALADCSARPEPEITIRSRRDGAFARLEIEDNGPGIEEGARRRIFEPYFSTKGPGRGTGLGLAVVYFIVTQRHGGTISVDSAPGRGTTFAIRLPAAGESAEA